MKLAEVGICRGGAQYYRYPAKQATSNRRSSDLFDDLYKVESALLSKRFSISFTGKNRHIFKQNIVYSYKELCVVNFTNVVSV